MTNSKNTELLIAAYDVSGIQEYIFATNRLRENAGASLIVSNILQKCLPQALKHVQEQFPVKKMVIDWRESKRTFFCLEEGIVYGEIIYIGGGNALVAYRDRETYVQAGEQFAREVLRESSSLMIVSHICEVGCESFSKVRARLLAELEKKKNCMIRWVPRSSFAVAQQDTAFGMPVIASENGELLTREQVEKRSAYRRQQGNTLFGELPGGFVFAREMEDLTLKRGEDSTVAVIHIDGNGMGDYIQRQIAAMEEDFSRAVGQMRQISTKISSVYMEIFKLVCLQFCKNEGYIKRVGNTGPILSMRPILIDGDDVTFICNAKMAIPAVVAFLRLLMQAGKKEGLTACAGIVFVHSHYPFRLAYEMAEECCASAKKNWYEKKNQGVGYVDFELVRGAGQKELERRREERFCNGIEPEEVIKRPYCVYPQSDISDAKSIDLLWQIVGCLCEDEGDGKYKKWPRSRLKKLYEAYLKSQDEAEVWIQECASRGYEIPQAAQCHNLPLFDALELMDFYDNSSKDMLNMAGDGENMEELV